MLFSLAEIKIFQSNQGVFKSFAINQSESSINYREFFFSDINQSESNFNSPGTFNKLNVNQSELRSNSHGIVNKTNDNQSELTSTCHEFFNNFDIVCSY